MSGLMEWLQGKKTFIVMILAFIFNIGIAAGLWTPDSQVWELINIILGFLGLGALRSGQKTESTKVIDSPVVK